MNGRVQDPELGRFISADPFVQAPYRSQSLNRYSYVWNNPLTFVDPSGFETCGTNDEEFGGDVFCGLSPKDIYWFYERMGANQLGIADEWGGDPQLPVSMAAAEIFGAPAGEEVPQSVQLAFASRYGFYIHQDAIEDMLGDLVSKGDIEILKKAQHIADADEFQGPESAYRHAMRNPEQTPSQARRMSNEFVRRQFKRAWNAPTREDALHEFGLALHALQDATSPSHFPWKVWSGKETDAEIRAHVMREMSYLEPGSALHRATREAWKWYKDGRLPEGDLFRFGIDR
jgi:hypothetical protein